MLHFFRSIKQAPHHLLQDFGNGVKKVGHSKFVNVVEDQGVKFYHAATLPLQISENLYQSVPELRKDGLALASQLSNTPILLGVGALAGLFLLSRKN